MPMPSYKRHIGIIGQSSHGNHNAFGGNGSKGASDHKLNWGHLKDAKASFKSPLKSYNFDKKVKHEKATSGSKSYDSWNKAKAELTEDEFNKRR
jgi:ribosomal protein L14E/L6E/L27E